MAKNRIFCRTNVGNPKWAGWAHLAHQVANQNAEFALTCLLTDSAVLQEQVLTKYTCYIWLTSK